MQYKFVWADGELEFGPGSNRQLHHFMLLEKLTERLGEIESYVGGTFTEDNFHDGQFDSVTIDWPGQGDVPSLDELRQLIQLELGRYRFDVEAIVAERVAAMKMGYGDLNDYEQDTGRDHTKLRPFIWFNGVVYIGDPEAGHAGLVDEYWDVLKEPFYEYDYLNIPGIWYIGRVTRSGEVIPWDNQFPIPEDIQAEIGKKRLSATSEDTEPEGLDVGFLREPHDTLYPPLFDGAEPKPAALRTIKDHVLNQLALNHYEDADEWIHFSIYGSGISFNWDELGDMDVQMWVDVDKFNERHPKETFTADELVAEVRRIVQMVNFPSFHQLGLSTDDVKGDMLIQYYPKPGKGTEEENLASKPYACYDVDNERWLQRPRPINPTFYGEHFLMVMTKAEDIAKQAEALLEQLNRNTVSWQFWSMLYHKYRNEKYLDAAELAERNADAEKLGVQELFKGIFGGRAKAYSEEGKGVDDERDIVQKLLEVWGIFQRLKHFARQPLPWEEQELPAPPERGGEGPTEDKEPDSEYEVDEPEHPTTLTAAMNLYRPYAYNEITGELIVGWHTDQRGYVDSHEELIDRMIDEGIIELGGEWDEWHYGYVASEGDTIHYVEPWSDFFRGAENEGAAEQKIRAAWPNKRIARSKQAGIYLTDEDYPIERDDESGRPIIVNRDTGDIYVASYGGAHFRIYDMLYEKFNLEPGDFSEWHGYWYPATSKFYWYDGHGVPFEGQQDNILTQLQQLKWKQSTVKLSEWQDIMQNAQALRDEGAVQIVYNGAQHVEGTVASQSEPGTVYETSFERDDPNSSAITTWNCTCPWGEVSWGRTRQWKKYEGRPCKHTLALYWDSLATPLDEDRPEAQGQGQLFNPAELNDGGFQTAPAPGGPNMGQPIPPAAPAPAPAPAPPPPPNPSVITGPGQGGTVHIPGTFSKIKESDFVFETAFYNGQVVRAKLPMWGIDRDDNAQMVPQNALGEVLWSDDTEAIVIFPLDTGALEPHLVRVKDGAGNFARTRARTPFVKRMR